MSYERLVEEAEQPRTIRDHTARWEKLQPLASVNGDLQARVRRFCECKGISIEALLMLEPRLRIDKGGLVSLAYAGRNHAERVTAIKYRPLDAPSSETRAEAPSVWLRPIVAGARDSLEWFLSEGETDGARLLGLLQAGAAVIMLPCGSKTFKRDWADEIPRGATVYLCHDADEAGDEGAAKAATVLGGRALRLRPPEGTKDWCEWKGEREAFLELVKDAKAGQAAHGGLVATPLSGIEMRSIEWLEKPLWQGSAFQLVAGAKGSGKGTYLASLAARRSKLGENVLFIASEDSVSIDLTPRLVAAGADLDRCSVIEQHVRLPDDVEHLRALANDLGGVGLLIIDPVANHIGDCNSNSDAEVRNAIAPLNKLADDLACLLIGVRHPGKDRSRGALASILGSTAWVDLPRAVVMLAVDNEDPTVRLIQVVAGNRALDGAAQAFRIEAVEVEGLSEPITRAVALGESAKSVDDLLMARERKETRSNQARELLLDILEADGDQESDALDARVAQETRLSARTVVNVRKELRNEGLIKAFPDKDEEGEIRCWKVVRTQAPRT